MSKPPNMAETQEAYLDEELRRSQDENAKLCQSLILAINQLHAISQLAESLATNISYRHHGLREQ